MNDTSNSPTKLDASMQDMLRMMDVASALRRERESAQAQLDLDGHKVQLRERLLLTAAASGEQLTALEVDAAIAQYFARQHRYQEPPAGWGKFWATVWVLRTRLLVAVLLISALVVGVSMLANAVTQPPREPRARLHFVTQPKEEARLPATEIPPAVIPPAVVPPAVPPIEAEFAAFEKLVAIAQQTAADEDARRRVEATASKGMADHARDDLNGLRSTRLELDSLMQRLEEDYVVRIVSRSGQRSGVYRIAQATGNVAGYYLIVEALPERGRALLRHIKNAETGSSNQVRIWGEQVPKSVYDRIVADKVADGVIDENVFARKQPGHYQEQVELDDGSGKAIARGRRITKWDN